MPATHDPCLLNTTKLLNPITPDSFKIAAPEGAKRVKVTCMDTLPWIPVTQPREVELECKDGYVACDVSKDVLYIAQVERYGINGQRRPRVHGRIPHDERRHRLLGRA